MIPNNRFKIKSTEGFKKFAGIAESTHSEYYELTFSNNESVKCSGEHIFWNHNNELFKAKDLSVGMKLKADDGFFEISNIDNKLSINTMYDIIEVENIDNNFILSNSLKTHNCQFLTFEKSLIDTDVLDFYKTAEISDEINGFNIYKDEIEHEDGLLIITIDPSAGGDDSSVIQIWEIAPQKVHEMASLSDPDADASIIFEKLLWLQDFMREKWNYEPDESLIIFERNGIGEGLAQILTQTEKAIEYLEMPIYYDNKSKPGVHTTPTSKNKLALQFKNLVEFDKMKINDPKFIDELYGFVRTANGSYSGKSGYHDDRVMAAFLMVFYLMNEFANYAQGDFSVDNMMLVKQEDKIVNTNKTEHDPAVLYRERMKKAEEEKQKSDHELIEEAKKREREAYAKQAQMGSSVIEEDDDSDEWDINAYDILPTQSL